MATYLLYFSDPDSKKELEARAGDRANEYLAGHIGEATFLRSLMIYGYSQADARNELWKLQAQEQDYA